MAETNFVCDENAMDEFVKKMNLLNELLDNSCAELEQLLKEISETKDWVNYGQTEMQAYLELLVKYHLSLNGGKDNTDAPTKKMVTHLKNFLDESKDLSIVFKEIN